MIIMAKFTDFCKEQRDILEFALQRKRREYDEDRQCWIERICPKDESVKIGLQSYDAVVYQAEQLRLSALALERILEKKGLGLNKGYTLQEYVNIIEEIKVEEQPIKIIK